MRFDLGKCFNQINKSLYVSSYVSFDMALWYIIKAESHQYQSYQGTQNTAIIKPLRGVAKQIARIS